MRVYMREQKRVAQKARHSVKKARRRNLQVSSIGSQREFEFSCHFIHFDSTVAGKSRHDNGMIFLRIGQASHGYVRVAHSLHLEDSTFTSHGIKG
jgi:hypothetical protein